MVLITYGYCINDTVEFRLTSAMLVNTLNGSSVRLRKTMARLLGFLLSQAKENAIKDDVIMTEVFENFDLRCSRPRLWQAMHTLEELLRKTGVDGDVFTRQDAKGYSLRTLNVRVLFYADDI